MEERLSTAAAFERLVEIVARLRAPDGCPWDREQTHLTLRHHLLEESYETLDAIERGDDGDLCEELGDVMMQPVLHAQIAAEEGRFDVVDVLQSISDKLVRRHPHVFGSVAVADSAEVIQNWDAIKRGEKAAKTAPTQSVAEHVPSALDDVPNTLPALVLALKVSKKAAKVGFEWPAVEAVMDKLREETQELESERHDQERATEELGDLLFTVVNVARWQHINPELALRDATLRFSKRFRAMEAVARTRDMQLESLTPDQWEELWAEAKRGERGATKGDPIPNPSP